MAHKKMVCQMIDFLMDKANKFHEDYKPSPLIPQVSGKIIKITEFFETIKVRVKVPKDIPISTHKSSAKER